MQKKDYMIQLLKYFIMAVIVGIIVGAIDALFGRVLIAIQISEPYIINTYCHSANCRTRDHSNILRIQ